MPHLTLTGKPKATTKPWLVTSYDIQPGIGLDLFWDTQTHTCLVTYLFASNPHGAKEHREDFIHTPYLIVSTGAALPGNNDASAELTTANGRTFTLSS